MQNIRRIEINKSANNWIKGSNLFDGMVVCKWQDSIDLYKFEIGDIY